MAVTFGIWTGLTLGVGPIVLGMLLGLGFATLASSGWAVMLAMTAFGVFIVVTYGVAFPEWIGVWALNIGDPDLDAPTRPAVAAEAQAVDHGGAVEAGVSVYFGLALLALAAMLTLATLDSVDLSRVCGLPPRPHGRRFRS